MMNIDRVGEEYSFLEVGTERNAWHKQGSLIEPGTVPLATQASWACEKVNGNYQVALRETFYRESVEVTRDDGTIEEVPNFLPDPSGNQVLVRLDNGKALATVGSRYTVLQNTELANQVDPLVEALGLNLSTCGVLSDGRRMFWLFESPETFEVVGQGDEVKLYLLVRTSHDGSASIMVLYTPVYVVCQNTETAAIQGAKHKIVLKHTKNVKTGLSLGIDMLRAGLKTYAGKLEEAFRFMQSRDVNEQFADHVLRELFPAKIVDGEEKITDKIFRQRREIRDDFFGDRSITSPVVGKTRWGFFNTITEHTDRRNYFDSIQNDGESGKIRQKAFDLLTV